ncbi:peptidylprolyl isomerase [Anaeromyxobacter diazotrophicus]|uniref:Periplasmic chaperone PpiD n=1 Tax=Anaeromyxobacter diazotrophicus TaxID=2590199 RepID=A0A7I9VPD0_9BACT|nr:peptidylprolyl isomerase [Anaeromyxobacter diazotrophicus]GEJ57970.1 peptidylprolyl isomerase [Anaeromyxobacter diazotrophicus]
MLDTLRANSRSVLTYVLFGIIIIVFVVSFGPGSKGCSGGDIGTTQAWAAKVNGEAVSPTEFDQQYGQLLRIYQQQGAPDLNALLQTRLRQMAMDQLVQRELIDQEAQRQGIVVSDDELSNAIKNIPSFQSEGRFDMELYRRAVTSTYGSPGKFEERMRKDLAYQKMVALLRGTAKVTPDEVKDAWAAENDRLALELARFPFALARAEVKVTDAEVKAFLAKNGAQVEQYFKDHPARFDRPRRLHARHLLVAVAPGAPQDAQEAAKKKIDALAERVKKGEDFGKLAQEASDDPGSKAQGGDLGFFGPGVMAKPFEDAAGKLSPGQVSEPVRTEFGWHLVKLEGIEPAKKETLDEAKPEIARELLETEAAKKLAGQRAEETLKKLQSGKSFAEVLPAKGAQVKLGGQPIVAEDTGTFPVSSAPSVPRLGPAPELFADAVKAAAGQVLPRVYETAGGPVVARVKERQRADLSKLAEHQAEVETRLRLRRESELERAWVESLRKKAKVQTNEAFVQGTARAAPVELD